MQVAQEVKRLVIGSLIALTLIVFVSVYWAISGPERILQRDDNPRLFEAQAAIQRGDIVDRWQHVLATSKQLENNHMQRIYPEPSAYSALGYYSLRYGTGGAEAAFDATLSGNNADRSLQRYVNENVLHVPRQGGNIRISLDLRIQAILAAEMANQQGAAIILSLPDESVLGMLSLPDYDPNTLDSEWNNLVEADGNPFFNRALQGNYQPGGLAYLFLLMITLIEDYPLDTMSENAHQPLQIDDLLLECMTAPPQSTLTVEQAFHYGCPAPFLQMIETIGLERIEMLYDLFQFKAQVELPGFIPGPEADTDTTGETLFDLSAALGQGNITITPIHMAAITASIINNGNAPQPHILLSTSAPTDNEWTEIEHVPSSIPITTNRKARDLQAIIRFDQEDNLTFGGYTALAFSGDGSYGWFVGFARSEEGDGIALALVIENEPDLDTVRATGRSILTETAKLLFDSMN